MDKLELLLFDVGHGLSLALIERPENYVTVIDLGSNDNFSPLEYLSSTLKLRTDVLFITHPHGDHLSDIDNALKQQYKPNGVIFQTYDWNDVKNKEKKDRQKLIDSYVKLIENNGIKEYNGYAELRYWYYTPENSKNYFGETSYVNNSSLFIIYKWQNFKIAIPGDLETKAMDSFCEDKEFVEFAKNSDVLITPHHGHKQGYCNNWVEKIGKPYITLISIQTRDQNIATQYQSSNFAKGIRLKDGVAYSMTTRSHGNIKISMDKDGWNFTNF
jgi:beta-lactamase superfamily II metal-dependent hydrolase